MALRDWGRDFVSVIFPNVCEVCGATLVRGEDMLCLHCRIEMPRTHIHTERFNEIHRRLASPGVPVERAGGYFYYYRGNPYAAMIHSAKYRGRPRIARRLAEMYAGEISGDGFFDGIDAVIPVPLHRWKLIRRGYNQSQSIADGISAATGIPVADNLKAVRGHETQTHKNRYERWLNASNLYAVSHPDELSGQHLLVVDDVITTGATLLSCCRELQNAVPDVRLSVLTLGVARNI